MRATAKLNEMPFLHSFFLETRFVSSDATPPTLPNNADAIEVKKICAGQTEVVGGAVAVVADGGDILEMLNSRVSLYLSIA